MAIMNKKIFIHWWLLLRGRNYKILLKAEDLQSCCTLFNALFAHILGEKYIIFLIFIKY